MKRVLVRIAALVGVVFVGIGALVAVVFPTAGSSVLVRVAGGVLALFGLVVVLRKVWGSLDATSDRPVPWTAGEFATPAPERTDDRYPLSSDYLARGVREAGETARSEGTVDEGVAVVRPALRRALVEATVQGRRDRDAARRAMATGEWTDDPVAASVLDPEVSPPALSLRERVEAWLFPERVARRRIQRAVQAVAEVADETVPTVPGQTAPRTVPVVRPGLEELRRGTDGHLQRAVNREVVARGPSPPDPDVDPDEEVPEA